MSRARNQLLYRAALALAVTLTAGPALALVIVPTFTASVTPQMQSAVNYVINEYESHFSDPITISVTFNAQTQNGTSIFQNFTHAYNYAQLRNTLIADATTPTDASVVASLDATDPTGGATFAIAVAETQALGLSASGSAGTIRFSSNTPYTFDPSNRAVAGDYDFIGIAENTIGYIMGGMNGGTTISGGTYYPLDLLRYSGPGVRALNAGSGAYFSTDGGVTDQHLFAPHSSNDWDMSQGFDAFDHFGVGPDHEYPLSQVDLIELDSIGWDLVPEPSSWLLASFRAILSSVALFCRTTKQS